MSEYTTHTASIKRLERTPSDKKIAGVAGGLGRYFELNPNVFRLGFVILTILGGAGWVLILVRGLIILWATRAERGSRRVLKVVAATVSLLSVAIAAAVIIAFSWFNLSLSDGIGNRTYQPATADVRPSYTLGIG